MSTPRNIGHVDADLTARDITSGLSNDAYEAQFGGLETYWFVGGAAAPTAENDWLLMERGAILRFMVTGTSLPIWTRAVRTETAGPIALRRWPGRTFNNPRSSFPHVALTSTPADLRSGLSDGDYRGRDPRLATIELDTDVRRDHRSGGLGRLVGSRRWKRLRDLRWCRHHCRVGADPHGRRERDHQPR